MRKYVDTDGLLYGLNVRKELDDESFLLTAKTDGEAIVEISPDVFYKTLEKVVNAAPAADVAAVRHSHWEQVELIYPDDKDFVIESVASMWCPKCKRYHNEVYFYGCPTEPVNFCPYCGATMDEGNEQYEKNQRSRKNPSQSKKTGT